MIFKHFVQLSYAVFVNETATGVMQCSVYFHYTG